MAVHQGGGGQGEHHPDGEDWHRGAGGDFLEVQEEGGNKADGRFNST